MALEASEVAVRVRLLGGSAFQKEADSVAGSTEAIGAAGKKANAAAAASATVLGGAGSKLNSVGSKMMSFGRTLATMGVPLAAAGYYAAKTASSFGQAMTLLSTQAGESAKRIGFMSKAVEQLAPQFGQTPLAMAQALYPIESIGKRGTDALNVLKAAAMGSAVGLDSLENTADAVTTIIASHIKGAGGPVEAMSLMDKAIGVGKMHLVDLTDSFKSAIIPMSQQFGLSFKQILAAGAALTRLGIPAPQVMARMRLALTSMVAPSGEGFKALQKMGIGQNQLAADLNSPGGLLTALEDLNVHTANMSKYDRNDLLAAIFGRSRGMGQITALLSSLPQMEQIYGQVTGTTPATLLQHFGQTKQTAAFKYQQLRARADAAFIKLGDVVNQKVLPLLVRVIPYFTKLVDGFTRLPKPLQDASLAMMGLVIVGGPFFLFTGALVKGAGMLLSGISTIVGLEGFGMLRLGIASTAAEFALLAAPIAAVLGVYEMWHNKQIKHTIEGAGKKAGTFVGDYLAKDLVALGFSHADDYYKVQRYLNSSPFKHLSPVLRGDITALMNPHTSTRSPFLGSIERDLKTAGISNVDSIPGISAAMKQAIKEGIKEVSLNVFLPNGRVLAQTVNEVNRKDQNRR